MHPQLTVFRTRISPIREFGNSVTGEGFIEVAYVIDPVWHAYGCRRRLITEDSRVIHNKATLTSPRHTESKRRRPYILRTP